MKVFVITICLICISFFGFYHAIHISYGQGTVTKSDFTGKVIYYKNDFFKALADWKGEDLRNLNDAQYDKLKLNYLQSHFLAEANNKEKLKLIITSSSEDESSIWFEFKFDSDEQINWITIKQTVLFKEFGDQMNLLNVATPSGDKNLIFTSSKSLVSFNL